MKRTPRVVAFASAWLLAAAVAQVQGQAQPQTQPQGQGQTQTQQAPRGPERWEANVLKFEEADRQNRPPDGSIVFVGASSIVRWTTLKEDFPGLPVLNRGYGGSTYSDITPYVDRILVPYKPSKIVIYSGDNDLDRGMTPDQVFASLKELVAVIHKKMPNAPIGLISVKPSLSRWDLVDNFYKLNVMLRELDKQDNKLVLIDIEKQMLGPDGKPNPELFVPDGLHLSPKGYEIWTAATMRFLKSQ
jgi:lysophospholipase L1-like esterase